MSEEAVMMLIMTLVLMIWFGYQLYKMGLQ